MSHTTTADETTRLLVTDFCGRHGIRRIRLTPMEGITASQHICNVDLAFEAGERHAPYRADFRLRGDAAAIGSRVTRIDADGKLELTDELRGASALDSALQDFFSRIERRVGKVRQEQSVQNIRFRGNRFVLNGTTRFTVVEENDGRLGIDIHKVDGRQRAHMLASALLDGLYDGSIKLLAADKKRSRSSS